MNRLLSKLLILTILLPAVTTTAASSDTIKGEHDVKPLRPCPSSPNCVSSQATDPQQLMEPIPFAGAQEAAQARLRAIVQAMPRAEIILDRQGYLAVSFRSRIFSFVDEAEFSFDADRSLIHFRSGARTGFYDFGVNRSRMEWIAAAFKDQELVRTKSEPSCPP